jgi:hydroxypyruvate isomerase
LLVEPVNSRDIPGFFIDHSGQALEIIAEVGSDNLQLQYDIYHMQVMEGDLARTISENLSRIGHVQIASYPFQFKVLGREGYAGWIGCEYKPLSSTNAGLGWAAAYIGRN